MYTCIAAILITDNNDLTYIKSVRTVCDPLAMALNSTPSRLMSSG